MLPHWKALSVWIASFCNRNFTFFACRLLFWPQWSTTNLVAQFLSFSKEGAFYGGGAVVRGLVHERGLAKGEGLAQGGLALLGQSVHSVLCVTLSSLQVLQSYIKMPSCLICIKNEIYAFFSMKLERHIWAWGLISLFPLLAMVRGRWLIEKKGQATKFTSNYCKIWHLFYKKL